MPESSSQPTTHPRNPFLSPHSSLPQDPLHPTFPTSMRALSLFLLLGAATAALRPTATICNKDDAAALLKLRAATAGDTWTITWPGADPCPLTQNTRYIRTHGRTVTILASLVFRAGTSCTSRVRPVRRVLTSSRLSVPAE